MLLTLSALALLTIAIGVFIAAPLFAPPSLLAATTETRLLELATRRASVYATLKELDLDRTSGKITEEDYTELRERYTAEAVELLRQIDELAPSAAPARS